MSAPDPQNDESSVRTSRLLCYVAAAVFLGCGALFWLAPVEMHIALRAVVAGMNGIIALACWLYGRQL